MGIGCYLYPAHFFSVDFRYMINSRVKNSGKFDADKGLLSAAFTIRM
jgi:hypothetical protein